MSSVKFIPASGTCESGLMIVGEAPGETEDQEGRPFCGRAGKLLDKMLDYIELNRENVYVTNVCKIRPVEINDNFFANRQGSLLKNRTPTDEELESWQPLLLKEIEEIKPKIILTLGACATKALLGTKEGITKLRGKTYSFGYDADKLATIVPSYHPAYLLRKSGDKTINDQVKEDLKLVKKLLD